MKMKAKTLRRRAWNHLGGKWGTVALIAFVHALLISVASALSTIGIGAIALFLDDRFHERDPQRKDGIQHVVCGLFEV